MSTFYIGCDLGQKQDYTAIAVLKPEGDELRLGYLARLRDTPYTSVVDEVQKILHTPPLYKNSMLVIDATMVGIGVKDIFRERGISLKGVTIHGGMQESRPTKDSPDWGVPKMTLLSRLQVLFERGLIPNSSGLKLKITRKLALGETLKRELQNLRLKRTPSGKETFEHREGEHDDLVLATALAAWAALKFGGPVLDVSSANGPFEHRSGKLPFEYSDRDRAVAGNLSFSWE